MPWCGTDRYSVKPVRINQRAGFRQRQCPKVGIGGSLIGSPSNVLHVVPEHAKSIHSHPGDVLIDEDAHPL
jgi:hypothetical protein